MKTRPVKSTLFLAADMIF